MERKQPSETGVGRKQPSGGMERKQPSGMGRKQPIVEQKGRESILVE
jgi:hypothetical protein